MPRKPTPPAAAPAVILNEQALAQASAAATELVLLNQQRESSVRALAESLGYDLPADAIDPDLIQRDIAANMRRSVEACLEVGKALNVLKAACEPGSYLARLDVVGIDRKVAAKFMQASVKFANVSTSRHLLTAAGTQSKLFELLVLDDEQIEELELTGKSGELVLDEIACMGTRELRAALREAKESLDAKDGVIKSQNDKISNQAEQLKRPFKAKKNDPAKTEEDAAALAELIEATNGADVMFSRLGIVVAELQDHSNAPMRERALQSVQYLVSRLREVVMTNALEVRVDDETLGGRPEWLGSVE